VPVQEYPAEGDAHPLTVESVAHVLVVVVVPPLVQQKSVDPALPATPVLQTSVLSVWSGVSELAHENPYEPPAQPATVSSGAHVPAANVSAERQQYSVEPALPGTPTLHDRDGSLWSGASVLVHEYPVDGELHPVTVPSTAHEEGITAVVAGGPLVQQKSVDPALPGTPVLHTSVLSV